jgi:hypothetical protein
MNTDAPIPFPFKIPDLSGLFQNVITTPEDVRRRLTCVTLAGQAAPKGSTVYDVVALADYLDRGHIAMDEPAPCSCNQPDATHERGDSAFCSMAAE